MKEVKVDIKDLENFLNYLQGVVPAKERPGAN